MIDNHCSSENDFHEVIKYIYDEFEISKCDLKSCNSIKRNYRDRTKYGNNNYQRKSIYYGYDNTKQISSIQICDIIHSYIFHTYDLILIKNEELQQQQYITSNNKTSEFGLNSPNALNKGSKDHFAYDFDLCDTSTLLKKKKLQATTDIYNGFSSNNKFFTTIKDVDTKMDDDDDDEDAKENSNDNHSNIFDQWFGKYIDYLNDEDLGTKYKDLKDEMLNNTLYTISENDWNDILKRSMILSKTEKAKQLKSNANNYGLERNISITFNHIMCIIFYCDYKDLRLKYLNLFKIKQNEKLESFKNRHSELLNFSLLLCECYYGFARNIDKDTILYHGINKPLMFSDHNINIFGPLSMTKEFMVSQIFSQSNNYIIGFKKPQNSSLKVFDCSWISSFQNEHEYFTINYARLRINNIFDCREFYNYSDYFYGINILLLLEFFIFY